MKYIQLSLILLITLVTINCQESSIVGLPVPQGFYELGHYGKNFATRKTYFRGGPIPATATNHKAACESHGLTVLQLDSLKEAEFFLSVVRNLPTGLAYHWVGVVLEDGKWIWRGSNERINFELPWATGFPIIAPLNCLTMDRKGFANSQPCSHDSFYFCQRIGG